MALRRLSVFGLLLALSLAPAQRVGVIGDWGDGSPGRREVARLLRLEHGRSPLAALLTTGDNFYPSGKVVEAFLRELPPVPLYPAFGNHDAPNLEAQLRRFGLEKPHYRVRLGAAEFFFFYTESGVQGQRAWLDEALASSQAPWKVLVLHRPLRSLGWPSPTLRSLLEPVLFRHRVALVLAGHDHHYARLEAHGIAHVTTGGGGARLYPVLPKPAAQAWGVAHHALFLEVEEEALVGYALTPEGRVLDRFTLRRGSP